MRSGIVTVGLGFGDEGKGATVDFLCRTIKPNMVVRYGGGPQCRHTVIDGDWKHSFSQMSSGTFCRVPTYYSQYALFEPAELCEEQRRLKRIMETTSLPNFYIHPDCVVITPYHRAVNRAAAVASGAKNTCGMGIGETRNYYLQFGSDSVFVEDLARASDRQLVRKLDLIRLRSIERYKHACELADAHQLTSFDPSLFSPVAVAGALREYYRQSAAILSEAPRGNTFVFEGAQGVLLDEEVGFAPNNTWTSVTPYNAGEIAMRFDIDDVSVIGVTRCYHTRHGEGEFPTEQQEGSWCDDNNPPNAYQGAMRFGWFDSVLFDYAVRIAAVDRLSVTCLDTLAALNEMPVCTHYQEWDTSKMLTRRRVQVFGERALTGAQPAYQSMDYQKFLAHLSQWAPVAIVGIGPQASDYTSLLPF